MVFRQIGTVLLAALFCAASCTGSPGETVAEPKPVNEDSLRHVSQVDSLMQRLSVKEKVAQLFIIEISRFPDKNTKEFHKMLVENYGIGSLILMKGPVKQFIDHVNQLQAVSDIPLLVAVDAEWGAAMRFPEYCPYPRQALLGRMENRADLMYQMGRNVGRELKDLNILINLAPVADVCADPYNKAESQRSFGGDPDLVAEYASAYMKGMQDEGIYACGKHYPGIGDSYVDSHYALPVIRHSREHLDTVDLYPYRRLIEEGMEMVMIGHFCIPDIDSTGVPMSISRECIDQVLKKDQEFKGVVITDALPMKGIARGKTALKANLAVYRGGADMILMPSDVIKTIDAIADSVSTGAFPIEELDAKVRKVLDLKARAGYFDEGFSAQVTDLDRKISEALTRDTALVFKMEKAMEESSKPKIRAWGRDRTLLLDRK
jgi:beta-glucosidase-like glycosyl hydrolase